MEIRYYVTGDGKTPFIQWLRKLRNQRARDRIHVQLDRLRLGLDGDYRSVGGGVHELRIHYGPGYRIYFGYSDKAIILLLCGGSKKSQQRDIERAKRYWVDYRRS